MSDNKKDQTPSEDIQEDAIEDAEVIEETVVSEEPSEETVDAEDVSEETLKEVEIEVEEASQEADEISESTETPTSAEPQNSIMPMLLGGLVAGAIGFGAATVLQLDLFGNDQPSAYAQETRSQTDTQADRIAALEAELKRVEGLTDQSAVQSGLSQLSDATATALAENSNRMAALETASADLSARLEAIEARPLQELVSESSVEAYEAEMAKLRAAIADHRAGIEDMAAKAREAEAIARAQALKASGAALLTDLTVAVSNGAPFTAQIAALKNEGLSIPSALTSQAATGVPTQSDLEDTFPEAARAALRTIRQETAGEGGQGGVMAFLQDQLGLRSVAPKDGDSADAILSRAEADLKNGNLAEALAEIATLPETGQPGIAGWVATAQMRSDALGALDMLKQEFSGN